MAKAELTKIDVEIDVEALPAVLELRKSEAKLQELWEHQTELQSTVDRLEIELKNAATGPRKPIEAEAAELLGGGIATKTISASAVESELRTARHRLKVQLEAVRLQKGVIAEKQTAASRDVAAAVSEEHREIVRQIAEVAVHLVALSEQEWDLRENLRLQGFESAGSFLRPMGIGNRLGTLKDSENWIGRFLRECIEYGFMTLPEVSALGIPGKTFDEIEFRVIHPWRPSHENVKAEKKAPSVRGDDD